MNSVLRQIVRRAGERPVAFPRGRCVVQRKWTLTGKRPLPRYARKGLYARQLRALPSSLRFSLHVGGFLVASRLSDLAKTVPG